jgi:hypothetical protein
MNPTPPVMLSWNEFDSSRVRYAPARPAKIPPRMTLR